MQNIRVVSYGASIAVHWETVDARFHFYLDPGNNYEPFGLVIYKNSLADHGKPGYFDTRKLDARRKANAAAVEEIMCLVREGDLTNKAKAEYEANQAAEEQAEFIRMERRERAREIFNNMRALTNGDNEISYTLTRDDMAALLTFAPAE